MLLYVHSLKPVRAGHPADRLFVVTCTQQIRRQRPWITAWKTTITPDGIVHPAFKKPLSPSELETRGTVERGRNGSEPTALFREDSFYIPISVETLTATIASLRLSSPPVKDVKLHVTGSMPYPPDGKSSNRDWINMSVRVEVPDNNVISQERKDAVQALFGEFLSDLKTI